MAVIEGRAQLTATITIALTEAEAGALDALAGYDIEAFIKTFYEKMGKAYLQPYESGLRSLFRSLQDGDCGVRAVIRRASEAREVFSGAKIAVKEKV